MKTVELRGVIVDAWFDAPYFEPDISAGLISPSSRIVRDLRAAAEAGEGVELAINSPGGIVEAGREISVALSDLARAGVPVRIVVGALAASAAAEIVLLAPTGVEVLAHVNSRLMFHSATMLADAGPDGHRSAAADLDTVNEPVIDRLVAVGVPRAKVEAAFREGVALWMTAKTAESYGIVDSILGSESAAPAVADPDAVARIEKPAAQLDRLAERAPVLRAVARLAALASDDGEGEAIPEAPAGEPAADPAPEAPAADPATPSAEPSETAADPAPVAAQDGTAPASDAPEETPPSSEPEPEPAPEPAAEPAPAPEAPPAPDERTATALAMLEKAEANLRSVQSASGKKIAALERELAEARAERDAARQSLSDLTARAEQLASLLDTERTKRASLVGGVLAPEGPIDTSVPPATATPMHDAWNAIKSLDERKAFAKAHRSELDAESRRLCARR